MDVDMCWQSAKTYGTRLVSTYGRRRQRMTAEEKLSKSRMSPELWAQLDAASRGAYVHHIPGTRRNKYGQIV